MAVHNSRLPTFLIIGAAKSGTSSLYTYLRQHPDIYMSPVKEPMFLAFGEEKPTFNGPGDEKQRSIASLAAYSQLFANRTYESAAGEASVIYLYYPRTVERIQRYVPDARLIAILRQPADRAFSHYLMKFRSGYEPITDFAAALQAEPERKRRGWHPTWFYRERGCYHQQLAPYYAAFPPEQINVHLYEDLLDKPDQLMQHIFRFLDVDEHFCPDHTSKENVGGVRPRNRMLYRAILGLPGRQALKSWLPPDTYQRISQYVWQSMQVKERLQPELRAELTEGYRAEILRLQVLIDRDLSHWLEDGQEHMRSDRPSPSATSSIATPPSRCWP